MPEQVRQYVAIDAKSFYASVECVERQLNPLTTHLVVADESRTEKTICLAVSPALKAHGVPGVRVCSRSFSASVRSIRSGCARAFVPARSSAIRRPISISSPPLPLTPKPLRRIRRWRSPISSRPRA